MIEITQTAQDYFQRLMVQQDDEDLALRISVNMAGTPGAGCDLQFCPKGQNLPDDLKLDFSGFSLYVENASVTWLEKAQIDFEEDDTGGQLSIKAPGIKGSEPSGALQAIAEAQDQSETAFPTATLDLICDMPAGVEDLRTVLAENRSRDLVAGRTLIGPHRADLYGVFTAKDVPAKDCSTGEQKALLVSLILANARALAADFGAPPILLLDEVAAHLDADRRASLYNEITALGAQAWMTGTGPELFAELRERAQILEVTDSDGASKVAQ